MPDQPPLRTTPLSIRAIARYWGMRRSKVASILNAAPDCEFVAGRWIVPLRRMPAQYLLDAGIVSHQDVLKSCAIGSHSAPNVSGTFASIDDH